MKCSAFSYNNTTMIISAANDGTLPFIICAYMRFNFVRILPCRGACAHVALMSIFLFHDSGGRWRKLPLKFEDLASACGVGGVVYVFVPARVYVCLAEAVTLHQGYVLGC